MHTLLSRHQCDRVKYEPWTVWVPMRTETATSLKVGLGSHQGKTLGPFLFAVVMDRRESLWIMMFADYKIHLGCAEKTRQHFKSWIYNTQGDKQGRE